MGRLAWVVEDGGGVSGSDERRLDGKTGVEEEGESRFTEAKDLGGLNLGGCKSTVRGKMRGCPVGLTLAGRAGEHGVEDGVRRDVEAEAGSLL